MKRCSPEREEQAPPLSSSFGEMVLLVQDAGNLRDLLGIAVFFMF